MLKGVDLVSYLSLFDELPVVTVLHVCGTSQDAIQYKLKSLQR